MARGLRAIACLPPETSRCLLSVGPRGGPCIHTHRKQPEIASQKISMLVETQLILPMYLRGRLASHWPYKFFRCEEQPNHPLRWRAAWGQFFNDVVNM